MTAHRDPVRWDPAQYARYGSERSRPFFDLVGRIGAPSPHTVVDLGCGSGELTASLSERWPGADVRGIDSSLPMLERAARHQGVTFSVGRAEEVDLTGTDVLVANAVLQWVPEHPRLLRTWAGQLTEGGWLAFQVPANFTAPSHRLMRELAESPSWRDRLHGVLRGPETVLEPAVYLDLLVACGMRVEAWQTEYLHVLQGPDPVLEWVRGTGLRPVLATLDEDDAAAFSSEYAALLREAYPARAHGTVFGFRRTFVVAHRA
jgi:trans-aconitate 2-methyltransferase